MACGQLPAVAYLHLGKERIIESLRPGQHTGREESTLRVHLSHLRDVLESDRSGEPSVLITNGSGYMLDTTDLTVDSERFVELVERARENGEASYRLARPVRWLAICSLAAPAVGVYATFIEPYRLQVEQVEIALPAEREGSGVVRVGVLADVQTAAVSGYEYAAFEQMMSLSPDVILLDLNMPKKDGREAIKEIKAVPALRRIPIIVLTTSQAEEDILQTYDLGVSSYITKPVTFDALVNVTKIIGTYWFETVKLPL